MTSLIALPSPATVYAAYASLSSSVMLLRTTYHQIVPYQVQGYVNSAISRFFNKRVVVGDKSMLTLVVEKFDQYQAYQNHLFASFEVYIASKATPIAKRLKIVKPSQKSNQLTTKLDQEETIVDVYKGVSITWSFFCEKPNDKVPGIKKTWFELCFEKIHKDIVFDSYIKFVMDEATTIQNKKRDLKLHTYVTRGWSSVNLEHSSTFETLAMEPSEKKALRDDLDLFVKRRDFFKRVGRAWKRGYLLYGPPGTGKSSLVAAMANYLKFDIYDLQLMNVSSDLGLRNVLMGIANRSILVIEDIDCSTDLPDRMSPAKNINANSNSGNFSLSGLLNFIDGIWSSCGDERIIIFTTNNKDKLDPALLRPGRMDMHIHMSYLKINGFKTLASTYLEIKHQHWRFTEIEELLGSVEATPAEVAEELMRPCDADACLEGLVNFLKEKKRKRTSVESKDGKDTIPEFKDGVYTNVGVELFPKAKKVKTDGSRNGLYVGRYPTPNGVVAPYGGRYPTPNGVVAPYGGRYPTPNGVVAPYGGRYPTPNGVVAPYVYPTPNDIVAPVTNGVVAPYVYPTPNGIVAPVNNFEMQDEPDWNVLIDNPNIEDDCIAPYLKSEMDDEDGEMDDEEREMDDGEGEDDY